MSIINDALKKTQLNLKKPKRNSKNQDSQDNQDNQKSKSGQDITNVYEKMYKAREEQKNASSERGAKGEKTSSHSTSPRQAKKWVKTLFAIVFFFAAIFGSFYFLRSYIPLDDFLRSAKKKSQSSRFRISKHVPAKRIYKPGELVLNGTSFIDGKNVALINDEIYVVGDMVDGKRITNVGLNKVELRDNEKIFTIKVR